MRHLFLCAGALGALSLPALAGVGSDVLINELDADQDGTDSVEFIELIGPGGTSLDGHFLVFYNGSDSSPVDEEYRVVELTGQTIPSDGYYVLGAATVPNVDFTPSFLPATNIIQNGADGVALWLDTTGTLTFSDFFDLGPSTPPAGAVLIDALAYDTNDSDDAALLAALNLTVQVNESENGASTTESIGRCPDGGVAFDTGSYATAAPTPGGPNTCGTAGAWTDEGNALAGVSGDPLLVGTGDLTAGSANSVDLSNAAPNATAALFLGLGPVTPVPFKGGTLVPIPFFDPIILATDAAGGFALPFVQPAAIPAGVEIFAQWAIQDAAAFAGVSLSNAVKGTTP